MIREIFSCIRNFPRHIGTALKNIWRNGVMSISSIFAGDDHIDHHRGHRCDCHQYSGYDDECGKQLNDPCSDGT